MNQKLNIGDYIVFIPKSKSKKITEIQRLVVAENFVLYPKVFYNKKYKIIDYDIVYHRYILQADDFFIKMYNLKYFKIKYKIIPQLHLKINKIIKL